MLSKRLKQSRIEKKLTQKEIADKLQISYVSYGNWERGTKTPNLERLQELSKILNVSTDYLLGNTDNRQSSKFDDDLNNIFDNVKSFDGKSISEHDKEIIKQFLKEHFSEKE